MKITLNVNGEKLNFDVKLCDQERAINEMTQTNKVTPMKNLLRHTIDPKSKDKLEILISKGYTVQLGGELLQAVTPEMEITVEKSEAEPSE